MKRALLCLAFLVAAACNNSTGVGSPCTVKSDCEGGLYCATSAPGGVCTRGCTFLGKPDECPNGTLCAYQGGTEQVCAPICTSDSQCREQFKCASVPNSTSQACTPKTN